MIVTTEELVSNVDTIAAMNLLDARDAFTFSG